MVRTPDLADRGESFLLDVSNPTWTSTGGASGVRNGSSVMYRPGKILHSGGANDIRGAASRDTTSVIDLTAPTPAWTQTAPMNNARTYHNLTMLNDGTVLAVGGAPNSNQQVNTTGVLPTEIWDPQTRVRTPAAPISAARNYHATSVLMPDATVLVAGGGHSEGLGNPGHSAGVLRPVPRPPEAPCSTGRHRRPVPPARPRRRSRQARPRRPRRPAWRWVFYADSGLRSTLTGGAGFTVRANLPGFTDMEVLAQDRNVAVGAVPAADAGTSARTVWLMATVVPKAA